MSMVLASKALLCSLRQGVSSIQVFVLCRPVDIGHVACRSLYTFVQQSSYDDCSSRKDFLQQVVNGCSQLCDLLGHEAFQPACCQSDACTACQTISTSLGLVLSTKRMLPFFEDLDKPELQRQAWQLQQEVERNSERGCGWALQREHALPVSECRQSLPAMVQALFQAGMCGSHVGHYDTVLQWVSALWSSYFTYPQHLLFETQSDSVPITLPHLRQLENQLCIYEASSALRSCSDTLAHLEVEWAEQALRSQVLVFCVQAALAAQLHASMHLLP